MVHSTLKLVCVYYGPANLVNEKAMPILLDVEIKAFAPDPQIVAFPHDGHTDYVGVYCYVPDDFKFKSVEIRDAPTVDEKVKEDAAKLLPITGIMETLEKQNK
jgi:hypothetical protein